MMKSLCLISFSLPAQSNENILSLLHRKKGPESLADFLGIFFPVFTDSRS